MRHENKGFLLIELLIAIFILTVCFLVILGVFPVSYKSVKKAKDVLFATNVARRQIERVCYYDFTEPNLSLSNATASYTCEVEGNTSTTEFIYNVIVSPDDDLASPKLSESSIKNVLVHIYKSSDPTEYVKLETDIAR